MSLKSLSLDQETMSFALPSTDMVYITGLPPDTTEASLAQYFGSIGIIKIDKKTKKQKIWLYRDKATGELKGDGTVSYEDPFSAVSAIEWFNNKEWNGKSTLQSPMLDHPHDPETFVPCRQYAYCLPI